MVRRNVAIDVQLETLNAGRALRLLFPHVFRDTTASHCLPPALRCIDHSPGEAGEIYAAELAGIEPVIDPENM